MDNELLSIPLIGGRICLTNMNSSIIKPIDIINYFWTSDWETTILPKIDVKRFLPCDYNFKQFYKQLIES